MHHIFIMIMNKPFLGLKKRTRGEANFTVNIVNTRNLQLQCTTNKNIKPQLKSPFLLQ